MDTPPKSLCAKCFNSLTSNFIKCHICRAKFHFLCARIDDKLCNLFKDNKNIVFNCNDCLSASSELITLISSMSAELRELKKPIISKISEEMQELKLGFSELNKNIEQMKQEMHLTKQQQKVNANKQKYVDHRSHANVVVAGTSMSEKNCIDDASSSVVSYPTIASDVRSNMYEAGNHHNDWTNVSRRKRRNRVLVVGEKNSKDLDVVVKKKFLHLSSFKPTVTPEQIIAFIENNTEIGKHHLECTRLVKKDTVVTTLKHVNFKLGVSPCFYDEIMKSTLWPMDIKIRPFIFFPRSPANLPERS